jgi:hypothetical protein
MTHCQSDPDANEAFASHFPRHAAAAGREALLDNSGYAIPGFLPAARRAMRRSNSNTHEAEQPESTAAE